MTQIIYYKATIVVLATVVAVLGYIVLTNQNDHSVITLDTESATATPAQSTEAPAEVVLNDEDRALILEQQRNALFESNIQLNDEDRAEIMRSATGGNR